MRYIAIEIPAPATLECLGGTALHPALNCFCTIGRSGVEAYLGTRCFSVDYIHQSLKQEQMLRSAQPRTDEHTIDGLRPKVGRCYSFRSGAEVNQASVDNISERAHSLQLRFDECPDQVGG